MADEQKVSQEEIVNMLDELGGYFGGEENKVEMENAFANVIALKECYAGLISDLNEAHQDLADVNKKNIDLRQANNRAIRQIQAGEKKVEQKDEGSQIVDELKNLF